MMTGQPTTPLRLVERPGQFWQPTEPDKGIEGVYRDCHVGPAGEWALFIECKGLTRKDPVGRVSVPLGAGLRAVLGLLELDHRYEILFAGFIRQPDGTTTRRFTVTEVVEPPAAEASAASETDDGAGAPEGATP